VDIQLFDNYDEIFSFYKSTKNNFQFYLRCLKHRIQIEKMIVLNEDKAETHNIFLNT